MAAPTHAIVHGVGSQNRHKDGVGFRQGAIHACFVAFALGLVVGHDDDRTPRIVSPFASYVGRRVEQPARDVGTAVEAFVLDQPFEFVFDIGPVAPQG